MTLSNPLAITYGDLTVGGGSSTYLIDGTHIVDKSFTSIRVVFTVVVKASSHSGLKSSADALELAFSKRDQNFTIALGGGEWEYTFGSTVLNTTASAQKTGNPATDIGFSRGYTCSIEGQLPATDHDGLRELSSAVTITPSRQKSVSITGQYTALQGSTALEAYQDGADGEATTILQIVDDQATWELVNENYSLDRTRQTCSFTRQYLQLLADQSQNGRDDQWIRDHTIVFTDVSVTTGDSLQDIRRLRRVVANFGCAVDVDEADSVSATWEDRARDHIKQLFQDEFDPEVFAIENLRVTFDETSSRISAEVVFLYQPNGEGEGPIEVMQSLAYREQRVVDATPLHTGGEFDAVVDPGFAIKERIWTRTVTVRGEETPKSRIGEQARGDKVDPMEDRFLGVIGVDTRNSGGVQPSGWNIVANSSQATPQWVGDPRLGEQMLITVLTETVVERFHQARSGGGGGPGTPGAGGAGGASGTWWGEGWPIFQF